MSSTASVSRGGCATDGVEDGLSLWRGRAFADFEHERWAAAEAARLEALRAGAQEQHIDEELKRGSNPNLLTEIESLVRSHPLRERPRAQLMRALYLAGRQADALRLYQDTRHTLVEELGIEPGPELQELNRRILNHDPALVTPAATPDARAMEPRTERKVVTVLFCDLVGFTSRAESLDPEDVSALLMRYHVQLRSELERFGGTVEKFAGDAVLAIFGAPVSHEDDAERAVRAALAIRAWMAESGDNLRVRIGIATGEVLVKLGASPTEGQTMAVGDVVNTAARLQQVAPQGAVLVGEPTYRATRRSVTYERTDAVEVKGKADPIPVWLATGLRTGADDERPTTPFVGRDRDLGLLRQTFERTMHEHSPQLVTILGEPGIGKTRLVSEFRASIESSPGDCLVRHGRCLAYGDEISFLALGQIVKEHAGILESDAPDVAMEKLTAAVAAVARDDDRTWLVAQLATLVVAARTEPPPHSDESWRRGERSSRRLPQRNRSCCSSRTCTGPMTRCSSSSERSSNG